MAPRWVLTTLPDLSITTVYGSPAALFPSLRVTSMTAMLPMTNGYSIRYSFANWRTLSIESTEIPTTWTPLASYFAWTLISAGTSSRQGSHQVAQKLTTKTLFRHWARLWSFPDISGSRRRMSSAAASASGRLDGAARYAKKPATVANMVTASTRTPGLRIARQKLRDGPNARAFNGPAGRGGLERPAFVVGGVYGDIERDAFPVQLENRYRALTVAGETALLRRFVGNGAVEQEYLDRLAVIGEELQIDIAVAPGRALEHRAREIGTKRFEQPHRLQRLAAQVANPLALLCSLVKGLVGPQFELDFLVSWQRLRVLRAQLPSGFALGESEILDPLLRHDPRPRPPHAP